MLFACGAHKNPDNMTETKTEGKFEIIYKPESSTFSSNKLRIVPTEPAFEPTDEQQKKAIQYLAEEYPQNEIRSILTKDIQFKDAGENFESVACNLCGQEIEIEYWQEAMDNASHSSFNDLSFVSSCCNSNTSLNDLDYKMTQGFSKYELEIINPSQKEDDLNRIVGDLQSILGKEIRLIWARH